MGDAALADRDAVVFVPQRQSGIGETRSTCGLVTSADSARGLAVGAHPIHIVEVFRTIIQAFGIGECKAQGRVTGRASIGLSLASQTVGITIHASPIDIILDHDAGRTAGTAVLPQQEEPRHTVDALRLRGASVTWAHTSHALIIEGFRIVSRRAS